MMNHLSRALVSMLLPLALLASCNDSEPVDQPANTSPPAQNSGNPTESNDPSMGIGAEDIKAKFWNTKNCVASPWVDAAGNPITVDEKFGIGTTEVTRCIAETNDIKVVYQINTFCEDTACTKPYALGNVLNQIVDYEVTHGIAPNQYEIVLVVHSGGWKMVLDPAKGHPSAAENIFASKIVDLLKRPSVKVLFCQNTASSREVLLSHMIDGIGFVTAGVSAITDLQEVGYQYIQP